MMQRLVMTHQHLMGIGFPYHSMSVIHRGQDLGFHVFFMRDVMELVTDGVKEYLRDNDFTFSYVHGGEKT